MKKRKQICDLTSVIKTTISSYKANSELIRFLQGRIPTGTPMITSIYAVCGQIEDRGHND